MMSCIIETYLEDSRRSDLSPANRGVAEQKDLKKLKKDVKKLTKMVEELHRLATLNEKRRTNPYAGK